MFPSRPNSSAHPAAADHELNDAWAPAGPETRHRARRYSRRTADIPPNIGLHTIEDGRLLFCVHPMWFPVVGYQFDVRNCGVCEYFTPCRPAWLSSALQSFATTFQPYCSVPLQRYI
jgi:hypothetical protein